LFYYEYLQFALSFMWILDVTLIQSILLFVELVNHWTLCILFFNYVACLCICVCTWSFQKVFHEPSSTCIGNYNVGESNAIGVPLEIPTIKHSQAMKVHSLMNTRNVWDRTPLKWQPMNHWSHLALFKVALKNKLHWSWVFLQTYWTN